MAESTINEVLIVDLHYFPCVNYFKKLIKAKTVFFERYEHYQKCSYRNRCYVAGPNGPILLSVPLTKGKNQRTIMKDVRICNQERWQALHWKTLTSAYRRSPWFEYYEDRLHPFFEKQYSFLIDWNLEMLQVICGLMEINITVDFTKEYKKTYPPEITDARNIFLPGKNLDDMQFIKYHQVFEERTGFLPNLSMLDLLFCEGKRAGSFLIAPSP